MEYTRNIRAFEDYINTYKEDINRLFSLNKFVYIKTVDGNVIKHLFLTTNDKTVVKHCPTYNRLSVEKLTETFEITINKHKNNNVFHIDNRYNSGFVSSLYYKEIRDVKIFGEKEFKHYKSFIQEELLKEVNNE